MLILYSNPQYVWSSEQSTALHTYKCRIAPVLSFPAPVQQTHGVRDAQQQWVDLSV